MNRSEIFTAVKKAINRQDRDGFLPQWLSQAEFRLNTLLRVEEMIKHASIGVDELRIPVPPDYLEPKNISLAKDNNGEIGDKVGAMIYVPPEDVDNGDVKLDDGQHPIYFTMRGRNIELAPKALDDAYRLDLWYYSKLPPLTTDDATNWLTNSAPHLYIMAMNVFGFESLKESDRAVQIMGQLAAEIEVMNQNAERLKSPVGPLIMRPARRLGGRFS